ncbi:hypothetical protein Vadar_012354 [Vaccinium darrowii]|uniref:Uncharacterized protein n=1 Tax=Vaccinium darrowii TaxID=229202 RepID=A0ACB7XI83_9ERIC|nr:hypothetical protein Vadar_012354 [Vaccinium darrowii]
MHSSRGNQFEISLAGSFSDMKQQQKVNCNIQNLYSWGKGLKLSIDIDRLLTLLVGESTQAERSGHPFPLTIVFVERKTRSDEVAEALVAQGLHPVALHGGRSQLDCPEAVVTGNFDGFFIPKALKVDRDNCKYMREYPFSSSAVPPITSLVMSM